VQRFGRDAGNGARAVGVTTSALPSEPASTQAREARPLGVSWCYLLGVALGSHDPRWRKLQTMLTDLASTCGAACAFIVDEGNGLWCVGSEDLAWTYKAQPIADRFYRDVVAPRAKGLRRGEPIDRAKTDGDDRYVAMSFANLYVAVIWYGDEPVQFLSRARLRQALPSIEALITSLPPSGGPDASMGAGKQRA